jgi:hypothetical protein
VKLLNLKVPFGTAKRVRVTDAKYLAWEDAFKVDFEAGLTFLEPHATIRKANKISPDAKPVRVELDEEPCIGFFVYYDTGQTAEVSWSFIRELPPKTPKEDDFPDASQSRSASEVRRRCVPPKTAGVARTE